MTQKEFKSEAGALALAAAILAETYTSYIEALEIIKKHRIRYLKAIEPKKDKIIEYNKKRITYKSKLKKKKLTDEEKAFIKSFENLTEPEALTNEEKEIAKNYEWAITEKQQAEFFYRSEKYKRFTLGKGVPGEDVIRAAKKEANWKKEVDLYKLTKYERRKK